MTASRTALVTTSKPGAYMRQLCKHFGHKLEADYGDSEGTIRFPDGLVELSARDAGLALVVSAASDVEAERVAGVMGSHLERFGRRDELSVSWRAA